MDLTIIPVNGCKKTHENSPTEMPRNRYGISGLFLPRPGGDRGVYVAMTSYHDVDPQ